MKELEEIERIIICSFDHTASEQELLQLKKWIQESPSNEAKYFQLKDVWDTTPSVANTDTTPLAWEKLSKQTTQVQHKFTYRSILTESLKIASVAAIVFLVTYVLFVDPFNSASQAKFTKVEVPYGSKSTVELPDGTTVMLNAGSQLQYANDFSEKRRHVKLTGEGYFNVAHDASRPFVVDVDDLNVSVLGTEFNIMAYPEFNRIETTLVNGKVQLSRKGYNKNEGVILKPGQKAKFKGNKLKIQTANLELETNWTRNEFYFESIPFSELMIRLEKWYDVKISFVGNELKDLKYTGKFRNEETIWQVLDAIQMTTPIEYTANHRDILINFKIQ
ncbi:FecR family protein [Saccharicrinis sp. GN24d3]|uniref:FecR family protein n=1 Tax=Saccharicrinis sp. GN24d3 TaxID=3458416 RepID=UPI004035D22D